MDVYKQGQLIRFLQDELSVPSAAIQLALQHLARRAGNILNNSLFHRL
jgi:hypothetical protein